MRQEINRMRPMGITDILDETVELYKNSFALLVGIAAVVYVPYFIIQNLIQAPQLTFDNAHAPQVEKYLVSLLGMVGILLLLAVVIEPLVTAALTYAVSERFLGRKATIGECFGRVIKPGVLFPYLLITLVRTLIVTFPLLIIFAAMFGVIAALGLSSSHSGSSGWIAFILLALLALPIAAAGSIYLGLRLALIGPAYIIEMKGWSSALKRTWSLMKGNILKAFALLLISGLITAILPGIVEMPTGWTIAMASRPGGPGPATPLVVVHAIISTIASTLVMPITSIVPILLYYDIRIRKEGFDLELLASELDAKTREVSAWSGAQLPQEQIPQQYPQEQAPPPDGA